METAIPGHPYSQTTLYAKFPDDDAAAFGAGSFSNAFLGAGSRF